MLLLIGHHTSCKLTFEEIIFLKNILKSVSIIARIDINLLLHNAHVIVKIFVLCPVELLKSIIEERATLCFVAGFPNSRSSDILTGVAVGHATDGSHVRTRC